MDKRATTGSAAAFLAIGIALGVTVSWVAGGLMILAGGLMLLKAQQGSGG